MREICWVTKQIQHLVWSHSNYTYIYEEGEGEIPSWNEGKHTVPELISPSHEMNAYLSQTNHSWKWVRCFGLPTQTHMYTYIVCYRSEFYRYHILLHTCILQNCIGGRLQYKSIMIHTTSMVNIIHVKKTKIVHVHVSMLLPIDSCYSCSHSDTCSARPSIAHRHRWANGWRSLPWCDIATC